uniref:Uncharacterized protein n=1 Tax=Arundo donax TaxID=35708 RepID=A0A0A8ZAP8_ARUDO
MKTTATWLRGTISQHDIHAMAFKISEIKCTCYERTLNTCSSMSDMNWTS